MPCLDPCRTPVAPQPTTAVRPTTTIAPPVSHAALRRTTASRLFSPGVGGPDLCDPLPRSIVPRRTTVDAPPATSDAPPNPVVAAATGVDANSGSVDARTNAVACLHGDGVPASTSIAVPATAIVNPFNPVARPSSRIARSPTSIAALSGPVDARIGPVVRPADRVVATVSSVDRPLNAVVTPIDSVDRPSMGVDTLVGVNVGGVTPADRCHRERTPPPRSIASTSASIVASLTRVDAAFRLVAQRVRRVDLPTDLVVRRANRSDGPNFAFDPLVGASELG